MRFGELASAMTDISGRMLAVRLKNLESHNLITERRP
ncbi:MAG: winged helix-turn-helix transcriptional regulator [Bacteroidales bacterium]|nr:winged helix-turn-helix transcriptional regulator [Bacteroidales bacterium]